MPRVEVVATMRVSGGLVVGFGTAGSEEREVEVDIGRTRDEGGRARRGVRTTA